MQRLHPLAVVAFFFRYLRFLWIPIGLLLLLVLLVYLLPSALPLTAAYQSGATALFLLYIVGVLIFGIFAIAWLVSRSYSYEITPDNFVMRYGVLYRREVNVPYDNVQNVNINRDILLRLLGLADLEIETAGSERKVPEAVLPGIARAKAEEQQADIISRTLPKP